MKTTLATVLCALLATGALTFASGGCATTSGATASEPVELDGTRWKMVVSGGRMDGRVVEFKKKGQNHYVGTLIEAGQRLRDVTGLDVGSTVLFKLTTKATNEYEGVYKAIAGDGSEMETEVVVFINGDSLTWNLESATWERQK